MVEVLAKEWSFNDALVPWILLVGYTTPMKQCRTFRTMTMKLEALSVRGPGLHP